jgi:hypothetical protein
MVYIVVDEGAGGRKMAVIVQVDKNGNEFEINGAGLQPDNVTLGVIHNKLAVKDSGINTPQLRDESVATAKIADGAVTNEKLAPGAGGTPDNETIEKNPSDQLRIKDLGVSTDKIADLGVTTGKIAANAVTAAKLATTLDLTSTSYTLSIKTPSYPTS